jgi:hypothetical protein
VAGPLAPHGGPPRVGDRLVLGAAAKQPAQVGLLLPEQAVADLAVGGERVRSQAPQNGWVTLAITPTLAGFPSTPVCPATSQVSAGAAPRSTGSGSRS